VRPGPRNEDPIDPMAWSSINAGDVDIHVALELEEIEMLPGALLGVVDGRRHGTLRMRRAAARDKIEVDVQTLEVPVKAEIGDLPGGTRESKSQREYFRLIHKRRVP